MTPFLQQVVSLLYQRYGTAISRMAFVFSNQRSGLFFRKYLSQVAGKPIFAPAILTINELFLQMSDKQPADRIQMLFLLYRIYVRHSGSDESFDDFIYWGEMLLNDFDDIDKYLVDARRLFSNIVDLRIIEKDFSYLQSYQIEAIRSFWSSFQPKGEDNNQRSFLEIWKLLYPVYEEFRHTLAEEKKGYEGMIAREVVERIRRDDMCGLPYEQVVFIGLNAISAVEKELFVQLQQRGIADFYWDYASDKVTDPDNKASFFVKEHSVMFPSKYKLPEEDLNVPDIELIGIPSRIGQAKQVYTLLKDMLDGRTEMDPEEALRTAIVLPDEQLLLPLLNSVPEEIRQINITLGYPLVNTPVAAFMEAVLALQRTIRMIDGQLFFYYRDVLSVLNHPYILSFCQEKAQALIEEITENNKIYVSASELSQTLLLSCIFTSLNDGNTVSDYLIVALQELNRVITAFYADKKEDEPVSMDELEQEFIYHYFTIVNRVRDMITEAGIDMSVETYFRLLKRMTDTITIPFRGEPLSGLQIMGVLETRVLDFDRLIILSVNEGIFPAKKVANSFIPYNLRRGFGLPTYEHQDSVWAYHFYRLIARAQKVTLLYDTRTDGLQTGEVSRFVYQLKYHYKLPVKEQLLVYDIASAKSPSLQIDKDGVVMEKLSSFLTGGSGALSASSINTYLDCPLKFYFSSVEELREEEVNENIESSLFGSILHRVLEIVYNSFYGAYVTADLLKLAAKESTLTRAIQCAFAELFFHEKDVRPLSGQTFLTGEMIRKYVLKVLERDRKQTPFRYIQSEKKLRYPFRLSNGKDVQLKGFIDRLDEINKVVRVVDYKTGMKKSLELKSFDSLFDKTDEKRPQAIMQVFMYAWMYRQAGLELMPVQPVIYYMRDLFSDDFDSAIYLGKEKKRIDDFAVCHSEFEENLRKCLDEIFDPSIPFSQTKNTKNCNYCLYNGICGKV